MVALAAGVCRRKLPWRHYCVAPPNYTYQKHTYTREPPKKDATRNGKQTSSAARMKADVLGGCLLLWIAVCFVPLVFSLGGREQDERESSPAQSTFEAHVIYLSNVPKTASSSHQKK